MGSILREYRKLYVYIHIFKNNSLIFVTIFNVLDIKLNFNEINN